MPPTWAWDMLYYSVYSVSSIYGRFFRGYRLSIMSARNYAIRLKESAIVSSRQLPADFQPYRYPRRVDLEHWVASECVWVSPEWDEVMLATADALRSAWSLPESTDLHLSIEQELQSKPEGAK